MTARRVMDEQLLANLQQAEWGEQLITALWKHRGSAETTFSRWRQKDAG